VAVKTNIGCVDNGPGRPRQQVVFDLGPNAGVMSSRYHEVVEGVGCVVLVYDGRCEDGNQYIPPERGEEPFTLHVVQPGKGRKTYQVSAMGLQFNLGCLDCIVLVTHDAQPTPQQAMAAAEQASQAER
jgi:hypothetical protein